VADAYHRPFFSLVGDVFDGLFSLDGRVARTLPALIARPGRVSRLYLEGARARFVPPFRLYIIASLVFFLLLPFAMGGLSFDADGVRLGGDPVAELEAAREAGEISEAEHQEALEALERAEAVLARPGAAPDEAARRDEPASPSPDGEPATAGEADFSFDDPESIRRSFAPEDYGLPPPETTTLSLPVRRFIGERAARLAADPARWGEEIMAWAPRLMFLLVPVYAGLLALSYAWRRGFFFYDHLIVSLHFHAALFLVMTALILAGPLIGGGLGFAVLAIYSNVYLYRIHRVVYRRGRITSVLRTIALDIVYFFVLLIGLLVLMALGFASL
jgi:hypothetical protein